MCIYIYVYTLCALSVTYAMCVGGRRVTYILVSHCLHLNEDKSQAQNARHKFSSLISKIDVSEG